jgi:hypothetical protein
MDSVWNSVTGKEAMRNLSFNLEYAKDLCIKSSQDIAGEFFFPPLDIWSRIEQ